MPFEQIVGHERPIRMLQEAIRRGRVAHAYLFAGPAGLGKSLVAQHFAAALVCADEGDDSCGICPACRKVLSHSHPDVTWYRPGGPARWIGIEPIRGLREQAALRPFEARRKVFIIDDADRMTAQAENCLLKTLEEPTPSTVLILVSSHPDGLLPTTLSRCRRVNFTPLARAEVAEFLRRRSDVPAERVEIAAALSEGCPGAAILAASEEAADERETILDAVSALSLDRMDLVFALAEELEARAAAYRDAVARALQAELGASSPTGEKLSPAEREAAEAQIAAEVRGAYRRKLLRLLDLVGMWYRDLLVLASGGDERALVNVDRRERMAASNVPPQAAASALDAVGRAKANLLANCNVRLLLDVAFIDIASAVGGA